MLTQRRAETNQSRLAWLRQMPEAAKPIAMLGLIERLDYVRAVGLDPACGHRVHQARLAQLVREAGRTTVQHVAGYERQRRHATLVAVALDLAASLTDQAINLFDRLIGTMFRKADEQHARAFQADGRAINVKVTFLDSFVFQGVPAAAALMRAIDMLRDMNRRAVLTLPKSAPISFIRERWARHVFGGGGIDR